MPGSIQNAAPATVLPASLSISFTHSREYAVLVNEYPSGESQQSTQAGNSRKSWRMSKRLTPTQLQTLRDFYDARQGATQPFWFYDPWETVPRFSSDPAGAATAGRYAVRFNGAWEQSCDLARAEVTIELVEVA